MQIRTIQELCSSFSLKQLLLMPQSLCSPRNLKLSLSNYYLSNVALLYQDLQLNFHPNSVMHTPWFVCSLYHRYQHLFPLCMLALAALGLFLPLYDQSLLWILSNLGLWWCGGNKPCLVGISDTLPRKPSVCYLWLGLYFHCHAIRSLWTNSHFSSLWLSKGFFSYVCVYVYK